ncbi:OLC1v1022906C2 [Oldenlandia corymbosa var. corymbosa]|uniref:OLC1v1022906C2 n=1 Tax=Oldenlandia corymbosa var. corymbosa TaxID=529605 RepID=A0AAV1BYU7_OLDCO|nr:OLC1v1022906C2 [Oldenlandia corymbosa var. corymbosa]
MEVRLLHPHTFVLLCFFLIWTKTHVLGGLENPDQLSEDVKKSQFPDGFLFGVATSAYQIEGATLEDGRGLSNWDVFVRTGHVKNGDTADTADDHYHRYLEDIEIIHSLGLDAYRFSISWTRILPRGKFGEVNPAGISFYNNVIDNLLLKGIQPFVTIHHEDYPQELMDRYGGWLSPLMQDDFVLFAEICFKSFGDRVKYWMTINEPNLVSEFEYERGVYPPARCSLPFGNCSAGGNSDTEPLISMHNMLLAHAKAAKLYREHFQAKQGGMLGIVSTALMYEPKSDSEQDREAAARAWAFYIAWTFDPVVFGDYPPEMRQYHGSELPTFTAEEKLLLRKSIDFMGLNHYGTLYAKDCLHSSCPCFEPSCVPGGNRAIRGFVSTNGFRDGVPIGEPTASPRFFVVPRGIEELVNYAKKRYNNMPMFITENGE